MNWRGLRGPRIPRNPGKTGLIECVLEQLGESQWQRDMDGNTWYELEENCITQIKQLLDDYFKELTGLKNKK